MSESTFAVYVHERGKRPRKVAEVDVELRRAAPVIPETFKVEDRTFYWTTADLTHRTLTYADMRPAPALAVPA